MNNINNSSNIVMDEMFHEQMDALEDDFLAAAGPAGSRHHREPPILDNGSDENYVHADFYNAFDDLLDDEDFE